MLCYLSKLALKVKAGSAEGSSCCKLEEREMDDCQLGVPILCEVLKDSQGFEEFKGDLKCFAEDFCFKTATMEFYISDNSLD